MHGELFDRGEFLPSKAEKEERQAEGHPRLRVPHRTQVEMRCASLDELLAADHAVRAIWEMVCGLDLSEFLDDVKAVEGRQGRNATDPRLLLALWMYAVVDGVASARELERRCQSHLPYQWLCGNVTVNYHMLSDFRKDHGEKLDRLFTRAVGNLLHEGLVTLNRVAQDGMRVRAGAGNASFRRKDRLTKCLAEAEEQIAALKQLAEQDPQEASRRQQAARERAARERAKRIRKAIEQCEEVAAKRKASRSSKKKQREARASTTDPDARIMQMADGGYRPACNVQLATDVESGIIVGVDVVNAGSDNGQMGPMVDQVTERCQRTPKQWLVDGGFNSLEDIDRVETDLGCEVYMPIRDARRKLKSGEDPYTRRRDDTDATARWRARMETAEAKSIYPLRAQSAEWVNAVFRNHNLWRMPVRGKKRWRCVTLLHALTHNLLRASKLRLAAAAG